MSRYLIVVLILIFSSLSYATTGGDTFRMGLIGPNLTLSEVYNSITSPGMAALYNPAGLAVSGQYELNFKYGLLSFDRDYAQLYLGAFFNDIGGFGLTYLGTGLKDIAGTDSFGSSTGLIKYSDSALVLSYGRSIIKDIDVGANVKYLMSEISGTKASGIGFDVGMVYNVADKGLFKDSNIHLALADIYSRKKWDTGTANVYPMTLRIGGDLPLFHRRLILAADFETVAKLSKDLFKTDNMNFNFGTVYSVMGNFNMFAGIGYNLAYYAGLSYSPPQWYKIDYKFSSDITGNNNWLGLEMKFGQPSDRLASARTERGLILENSHEVMLNHYIKGVELNSDGDYDRAMMEANEALKIEPEYKPAKSLKKDIQRNMKRKIKDLYEGTSTEGTSETPTETEPTK